MRSLFLLATLLAFLACPALAEDRVEHGDWVSQFRDGAGEASTHENGTSMFGMLCADRVCRYYFANGIPCEPGNNYPLMLTTGAGALAFDAICEPMSTANGDVMLYWFKESKQLNDAFAQSAAIGFAFPLTTGQFKISRFSMNGFTDAITRMVNGLRDRLEEQQEQPAPKGEPLPEPEDVPNGDPVPVDIDINRT